MEFSKNPKTFDIKSKQLITKINYNHILIILCLLELDDGRLVSGSGDFNIIVYNKITFKPDIIIKEHKKPIKCFIKMNSNKIISCSDGIKIFKIKHNFYEILQILDNYKSLVYKIIELKNKNLISGSNSIIFYSKNNDNDEYKKYYEIKLDENIECHSIIQTKETEICYSEFRKKETECIVFYDLIEKKIKSSIYDIKISGKPFNMITKDLLICGGIDQLYIINVNKYIMIRIVKIDNHGWYNGFCMLNENMFLTGSSDGIIRQWKIKDDEINLISKKENAHYFSIYDIIKLKNGNIASCSGDHTIKIW